MPVTAAIALAPAVIKGVTGASQYLKGRKAAKNLKRPEYEIPQEVQQNVNTAQQLAYQGLPASVKKAYNQSIGRSGQAALAQLDSRQGGLAGLGNIVQAQSDAALNLAGADAQAKLAGTQQMMSAKNVLAQYRDKKFDVNQLQPYYEDSDAAAALKGAGMQNVMGAVDSAASAGVGLSTGIGDTKSMQTQGGGLGGFRLPMKRKKRPAKLSDTEAQQAVQGYIENSTQGVD
jgi:hypothetical protein